LEPGFLDRKKILIVDDEPGIVLPLRFLIEQNGYIVSTAFSGLEAVEKISQFQPDLILLDILHPHPDGFEICRTVRKKSEWKKIKIIILTTCVRDVDIARGMAFGADAYIKKPFSNSEIIKQIKRLLKGDP
jgi:DNA-binding response OmpR family regulator